MQRSADVVKALRKVGGKPAYTEYAGVGHNFWTRAYATEALWTWLFAQRTLGVAGPAQATKEQYSR